MRLKHASENFALTSNLLSKLGGGGVLSIFVRQGCEVFQGIVFAYFSNKGYQKKALFLEQLIKTYQKRKFCYIGLLFSPIFVIWSILFTDFSRTEYHWQAKILEQGTRIVPGHIPVQNRVKYPPGS